MTAKPTSKRSTPRRGLLARPLDALVFLLPLIVFYQSMSVFRSRDHVIAFDLLRRFLEMFGYVGVWAPGLAVVAILLATHAASGERWTIHWRQVAFMYVEAVILAIPLLGLNWLIPLAAGSAWGLADRAALGIGAGIYEELVFRLVLISLMVIVGVDLLKRHRRAVAVAAILLSALAFAAHHHRPFGSEPFTPSAFLFRSLAGTYLALVFWFRGYGPAAGCHAAYNTALVCLSVYASAPE